MMVARFSSALSRRWRALDTTTKLGLLVLPLPVIVGLFHLDELPVKLCTFRATTGYACPSCGATRAMGSLADFNVRAAFLWNPTITVLWVLTVARAALGLAGYRPKNRLSGWRLGFVVGAITLGFVASWIYLIQVGR